MPEESKLIVHVFLAEKEEWQTVVLEGYGLDVQRRPDSHAAIQSAAIDFIAALAQLGVEARLELLAMPRPGGACELARAMQMRFLVADLAEVYFEGLQDQIGRAAAAIYHASETEVGFGPAADLSATVNRIPPESQL
jgi:hypothetical protein